MASSNFVGLKLHPERDADILAAIADAPDKSARLRELIREGLTVKRKTVIEDESVLRKTPDSQVSPNGLGQKSVEDDKPPQFVKPEGFNLLPRSDQNKMLQDYNASVLQWKRARNQ